MNAMGHIEHDVLDLWIGCISYIYSNVLSGKLSLGFRYIMVKLISSDSSVECLCYDGVLIIIIIRFRPRVLGVGDGVNR